mgnify:CR=1 FL=1
MNRLQERVLAPLAYYDAFDVPLTSQEVFLALPSAEGPRPSFEEIERALSDAARAGRIASSDGFHFLPGRDSLVAIRRARYALAEGKYARVRRFLSIARHAPFLRAAFVCNTLARSYARPESDIDLFLVTAPGRIWLARLFVTGLAALLRVRPTEAVSADRICLSFFVTTEALDLKPLAIEDDVYLAHWVQELFPVYDEAGIVRRSFVENGWLRGALPETRMQLPLPRRSVRPVVLPMKRGLERLLDAVFGDRLERWSERRQLAWMPAGLKAAAATPAPDVVLNDRVLKFHDHDRRAEIRDAYREKLRSLVSSPTHEPDLEHALRALA